MSEKVYGPVRLGLANYLLIVVCVVLVGLLIGLVICLMVREINRQRLQRRQNFRQKLRIRRPGISGASGINSENTSVANLQAFSNRGFSPDENTNSSNSSASMTTSLTTLPELSHFVVKKK